MLKLDPSPPELSENVLIFGVAYMDSGGFGASEMAERIAQNPINPTIERTTILMGSPTVPVSNTIMTYALKVQNHCQLTLLLIRLFRQLEV